MPARRGPGSLMYGGPMTLLRWNRRPEGLRAPALVFAFAGWNDAAEAATTALAQTARSLRAERVATVASDELIDYQAMRPTIDLREGAAGEITWPEITVEVARPAGAQRDLLLVRGPEPTYRWRAFCDALLGAAAEVGVTRALGLGALLADVPHTRPVTLTGIATPPSLVEGMAFRPPSYAGPTGIVGVLHAAAAERGLEAVSLWAPVPHYVAGAPNPAGALALVRGLERLTGVAVDARVLEDAVVEHERQVSEAVGRDPAARALVERLEQAADPDLHHGTLPSGDVLATEIERFLRQRGADPEA